VSVAIGIVILLLVFALVAIVEFSLLPRQAALYEEIIRRVEEERDFARNESRVYRGLLMPALKRTEAASGDRENTIPQSHPVEKAPASTPSRSPQTASRLRRLPFRQQFNLARKAMNTPQQRTDALAEALQTAREFAAQKPSVEEK
jgi:hypothetical protein